MRGHCLAFAGLRCCSIGAKDGQPGRAQCLDRSPWTKRFLRVGNTEHKEPSSPSGLSGKKKYIPVHLGPDLRQGGQQELELPFSCCRYQSVLFSFNSLPTPTGIRNEMTGEPATCWALVGTLVCTSLIPTMTQGANFCYCPSSQMKTEILSNFAQTLTIAM